MKQILVSEELLRQVLGALQAHSHPRFLPDDFAEAITALRTALEQKTSPSDECLSQPAVEPVKLGAEWTPCMKLPVVVHVRHQRPGERHISTREGITPVKPDDLIMRGVSGEEYPIGRAIFEQTYTLDVAAPQASESVLTNASAQQPAAEPVAALRRVMARLAYLLDEDQFAEMEAIVLGAGVAPQAQGIPPQWEHDFNNPMTHEQQVDWVNRERDFASALAQQPAPVQDPRNHVGNSSFESWYADYNPSGKGDKQRARDAYAAGMGDPVYLPAQQPRKAESKEVSSLRAVKLTNEELVDHYCAIADGKEWAIGGLSDAVPFARAIEQAVWEKLGVTT